jgi:cytochrome c oxidase cbb3-type subunit III
MRVIGIAAILLTAGIAAAQQSIQSPAARPRPKSVKQEYPSAQIAAGERSFASQCGFCHGRDAAGGETGPDLTLSDVVGEDNRGDKIGPFVGRGRPDEGMPAFNLSAAELESMVAFLHSQQAKFASLGGGRRTVDPSDLATGDAEAGRRYFNGAGGCSACHMPAGDLAGVATRYHGLALLERMLYPTNRPAPARPKVTVTLASGVTLSGPLIQEDEFTITVQDSSGAQQTYEKNAVQFKIDNPLAAHFEQLGKYTDQDMHNVFAYLNTLK